MEGDLGMKPRVSNIIEPCNPAFSPAVNIQFFEPLLRCHAHKPLITASACLWTPSQLSMSFSCLHPDLTHGVLQTELKLSDREGTLRCAHDADEILAEAARPTTAMFDRRAYGQSRPSLALWQSTFDPSAGARAPGRPLPGDALQISVSPRL